MAVHPQKPALGSVIDFGNPIARGLVLSLPLNEGTGAKSHDLTGQGNPGTVVSSVLGIDGVALDGSADYISLSRIASMTNWTLAIRYKPDTVTGNHPIIDQGDILLYQSADDLIYGITTNTWIDYTGTIAACLTVGTSVDIVVTRSGTTITLYVNGIAQGNFTASGTANSSLTYLIAGKNSRAAFVYPALTGALSGEKGVLVNASDDLRYSSGSASLTSGLIKENLNDFQGSLEFWVRTNWDGDDNLRHYFCSNHTGSFLALEKYTDNKLYFYGSIGTGGNYTAGYSISSWAAGDWHHVVCTYDVNNYTYGTDYLTLYVDGARVAAKDSNTITTSLGTQNIGRGPTGVENQFNGTIYGRFLNGVLSSTEISALYAAGVGSTMSTVVTPDTVWMGIFE